MVHSFAAQKLGYWERFGKIAGYFFAGQSETGLMLSQDEEQEQHPREPSKEALWLVYKWENLQVAAVSDIAPYLCEICLITH